ncbi:MAG: 5'-methylthioadenosine/S-adenosylhomocysteine nucleosidase [Bacteroidales bacterium]|nr:5'-methylthioadenosine/S-adenosylhomocysteine nucleosidase [Bacteroidales bacterium]
MKIGIIVALDNEYERLKGLRHPSLILERSGMGKVNAAVKAVELIRTHRPDCLLSTGVAGGLSPVLRPLDVVVSSEIVYHDVWCGEGNAWGQIQGLPPRFTADPDLYAKAMSLSGGTQGAIHGGLICSGDRFIATQAEGDAILAHFPEALAVDMESGALAQVCHLYGIPFLSFRIISDVSGDGHQEDYDRFWEEASDQSFQNVHRFIERLL